METLQNIGLVIVLAVVVSTIVILYAISRVEKTGQRIEWLLNQAQDKAMWDAERSAIRGQALGRTRKEVEEQIAIRGRDKTQPS